MSQQYIGTGRWGTTQNVAYTGTAGTITNGVSDGVTKLRLLTTTDAFVTTDGSTPTSSNGTYMVAYSAEYVTVTPGQKPKAVQVSSGGTLYVTECL
jgi:hypothetical protein